jgi:hypothetical protein
LTTLILFSNNNIAMVLEQSMRRYAAIHPHWKGFLVLSDDNEMTVTHEGKSSRGRYVETNESVKILWENYPEETFMKFHDVLAHPRMLTDLPDLKLLAFVQCMAQHFGQQKFP